MVWTSDLLMGWLNHKCFMYETSSDSSLFHLVSFKTFLMMFHIICTISYNIKVKVKQISRSKIK